MKPLYRGPWRYLAAVAIAAAAALSAAPALAEKPQTVLPGPTTTTVTALPIDFDRENPGRKEFGKLIFRAGLNLYAKSIYFGGYSAVADRSERTFAAGDFRRGDLDEGDAQL